MFGKSETRRGAVGPEASYKKGRRSRGELYEGRRCKGE